MVCTTIGDGSFLDKYRESIKEGGEETSIAIIVIPDKKTPASLFSKCEEARKGGLNISCPTVDEQDEYLKKLGRMKAIIPYNSDNRRNIGFLMALERGCEVLVSIDDDNYPRKGSNYFREHLAVGKSMELDSVESNNGWFNICQMMEVDPPRTFPRGFPYRHRREDPKVVYKKRTGLVHLNAGLWLGHPDIDAVSCLYSAAVAKKFKGSSVFLGEKTWTPINTQNTALIRDAVSAYYFIPMGFPLLGLSIDRFGDIFSGYFVEACVKHFGKMIRVGTPVVDHIRNSHNYLNDLTGELAGIWMLEDLTDWLQDTKLEGSTYSETYLCLADFLEEAVGRFSGFIWNNTSRSYVHHIAYCMREWIRAVRMLGGV